MTQYQAGFSLMVIWQLDEASGPQQRSVLGFRVSEAEK